MSNGSIETPESGSPELVVMMSPEAGLQASETTVASMTGLDVTSLADLVSTEGIALYPLFGVSEDRLRSEAATTFSTVGTEPPDLSIFYKVEAPSDRLQELAEKLREHELVESAFVKPPAEPAQIVNDMAPSMDQPPAVTRDFSGRQGYLNPAPEGVDSRFAWTLKGGSGEGVRIVDIEGAWRFSHEDLLQNQGGVIGGTPSADINWRNHGTAVVGEIGGDRNSLGIIGICPEANVRAISIFGNSPGWGSAAAIRQAANVLGPGDIILLELHRAGPRFKFAPRMDQMGYIAVEWWPDDMAAIQYAISRGVIVVEAGGNGAENLDDAIYDVNPAGPHGAFPPSWRNPFRRNPIDTGTIIVGAGAPPPGTHGNNHGPDRSRLAFSNFGVAFDAQGWGREVTTCGYGDLQGGASEDLWYTDGFAGTSSASPIVVGALSCVQGVLRAAGKPTLSPAGARSLLRATGSPQQVGPGAPVTQRIGGRPNIRRMIDVAIDTPSPVDGRAEVVEDRTSITSGPVTIQIPGQVRINIDVMT